MHQQLFIYSQINRGECNDSVPNFIEIKTLINYFRYLFNCGEGTQRLAHEHKTKLTRLEHIFITQRSWHRIGGLPGLSLTIQDAGVPNITLHGPDKLLDVFLAMRRFVILKHLRVDAPECKQNEFYEDAVLKVHYLPLRLVDFTDSIFHFEIMKNPISILAMMKSAVIQMLWHLSVNVNQGRER